MSAAELLDALAQAGGRLEMVGGTMMLRGQKISDELKFALKENRAALLEELARRQSEDRDRYGKVPPPDAAFRAPREMPPHWKELVQGYVMRQPRPVHAWVQARANDYFTQGTPADDADWRACVDVVAWQRDAGGREAVDFVVSLDEATEDLRRPKPKSEDQSD